MLDSNNTNDGTHELQINYRFRNERAAISKVNSSLWDRNVKSKVKTRIRDSVVKITIIRVYAGDIWHLK